MTLDEQLAEWKKEAEDWTHSDSPSRRILALIAALEKAREQRDFLYDSGLIADDRAFDDAILLKVME